MITNRLRSITSRCLVFAALAPVIACAVDSADEVGDTSQALCKISPCGVPTPTHPPRPFPPLPPIPIGPYVTVTSDELNGAVVWGLGASQLSIDSTETAPEVFGPETVYTNPDWTVCQQEKSQCTSEPIALRHECLDEVNERCAGVPQTITTNAIEYSYFTYGPIAHQNGATDVFFPLEKMHHSGSVFSFDIDVHYIHATFGNNVSAGFSNGSAWLTLTNIQSASPTIILEGNYPDFDFRNMVAGVTLGGFAPTSDGLSLDYSQVSSTFTFDWDANNTPDWIVSDIVDVNSIVQGRVTTRINRAFGTDGAHAGISRALTGLVSHHISADHPAGYSALTQVVAAGTDIHVYYVAK